MKHLIIIGGGFAGSYIARKLEQQFHVTLFDTKDYFEFTPSVLRTLVQPDHLKKIEVKHSAYLRHTTIIQKAVTEFTSAEVIADQKHYPFDYLVIASGSHYTTPIKEENIAIAARGKELREYAQKLEDAKKILIVGGGVVGVELAAEIIERYPNKKVTVAHAQNTLLERTPRRAQTYAEAFLRKRNVQILFRERVNLGQRKIYTTHNGKKLSADLVFLCIGISPNTEFFAPHLSNLLNEKNFIQVNNFLQLPHHPHLFAAGDCNDLREEKTAQGAEEQAKLVVDNLLALESGEKLKHYVSHPRPMVISLGAKHGIFIYKRFVCTGIIPGLLKSLIEWKTMRRYRT
ncbi:FAD-dependent oxidoreductase [Candidatus Woesearchaeota archaeon]|nr:FAD-dependent oxidoreductase [Candidatus Woesearchaeota archaeon]